MLDEFELALAGSKIVMAKSIAALHSWLHTGNDLMISFHKQVGSGGRLPEENKWDPWRTAAESSIHPHYYKEIQYACVSLDGHGLKAWGGYSVTFKDFVAERTTVLEENPYHLMERHKVFAGTAPPLGYRSTWADRARLAAAKHHSDLDASTNPTAFAGILVKQAVETGAVGYLEANIYGDLHRHTIASVIGPKPKNAADRVLWNKVKKTLLSLGASVVEL